MYLGQRGQVVIIQIYIMHAHIYALAEALIYSRKVLVMTGTCDM